MKQFCAELDRTGRAQLRGAGSRFDGPACDGSDQWLGRARSHTVREATQNESRGATTEAGELQAAACQRSRVTDLAYNCRCYPGAQHCFCVGKGFVVGCGMDLDQPRGIKSKAHQAGRVEITDTGDPEHRFVFRQSCQDRQ